MFVDFNPSVKNTPSVSFGDSDKTDNQKTFAPRREPVDPMADPNNRAKVAMGKFIGFVRSVISKIKTQKPITLEEYGRREEMYEQKFSKMTDEQLIEKFTELRSKTKSTTISEKYLDYLSQESAIGGILYDRGYDSVSIVNDMPIKFAELSTEELIAERDAILKMNGLSSIEDFYVSDAQNVNVEKINKILEDRDAI